MTIATEKLKQSIRRDTLVKLTVMMDATDHLTLVSGSNYKVYIPIGAKYEPVAAYQDATSLTKSWNSSTNELTVTVLSSINDDHPVTVKFYIYLTTGQAKYLDKDDPTGAVSNLIEWLPLLDSHVTQTEYIGDIFAGTFSMASSSPVSLINNNGYFNGFFERYEDYICPFSFYNNEVKIWQGFNDSFAYVGNYIIESMTIAANREIISFTIKPEAKKLMSTATFGDDEHELFAISSYYSELKPDLENTPIPLIFSPSHQFTTSADPNWGYPRITANTIDDIDLNKAICIDFNDSVTSGKNITYLCGRSPKALGSNNKVIDLIDGVPSNTITTNGNSGSFVHRLAEIRYVQDFYSVTSGMTVDVNFSSSGWSTCILTHVDHIDQYTREIWIYDPGGHTTESMTQIRRVWPVNIWYKDPEDPTNLLYTFSYANISSITQTTTKGGNKLIQINLNNTYYTSYQPNYEYYFVFFTDDTTVSPKELAYKFIEAVDLPHNHADTSYKYNPAFFQVPRLGDFEYRNYADYLPDIIVPMTMSCLRFDYTNGYYEFTEMPSTIDSSNYPSTYHDITDTDIVDGTLVFYKNYADIITKFIVNNKDIISKQIRLNAAKTFNNKREVSIYKVDHVREFNHAAIFTDVTPYDMGKVNDILKTPTVRYEFETSLKFYDARVLDVVKLSSSKLMNGINDGSEFVFLVFTLQKGDATIKIEGQQVTYL